MEDVAAVRQALTGGRLRTPKPKAAKRRSRDEAWLAQQRMLRAGEARMHEAHRVRDLAAHREAAAPVAPPDSDADRRINAIAESYYAVRR